MKRPSPNANEYQQSAKRIHSSQPLQFIESPEIETCSDSEASENDTRNERIEKNRRNECAESLLALTSSIPTQTNSSIASYESKDFDDTNNTTNEESNKCDLELINKCSEKIYPILRKSETVKPNQTLLNADFIKELNEQWNAADNADSASSESFKPTKLNNDSVELYTNPFKICVVQQFLNSNLNGRAMVREMCEMEWQRKQMDLYEFHQTTDLANLTLVSKPLLKRFYNIMSNDVLPWMKQITGLPLTRISASCSMYNYGDYLLVHDDLLTDRQIAFVYYLTPWIEDWTDKMGGALELFGCDKETGQPKYPIVGRIPPRNNQFVFFRVCDKSFHQVGEHCDLVYPRLTINGWFHGPNDSNKENVIDASAECSSKISENNLLYTAPVSEEIILSEWINGDYLKKSAKKDIHQHFEEKSEASLQLFLISDFYDLLVTEFKENTELNWVLEGPANQRKYETLRFSANSTGPPKDLHTLFQSKAVFNLLFHYTELDLDGPKMEAPTCSIQICRFTQGCYTLLDDSSTFNENALDVILFFNARNDVGKITYLCPSECINEYDTTTADTDAQMHSVDNDTLSSIQSLNLSSSKLANMRNEHSNSNTRQEQSVCNESDTTTEIYFDIASDDDSVKEAHGTSVNVSSSTNSKHENPKLNISSQKSNTANDSTDKSIASYDDSIKASLQETHGTSSSIASPKSTNNENINPESNIALEKSNASFASDNAFETSTDKHTTSHEDSVKASPQESHETSSNIPSSKSTNNKNENSELNIVSSTDENITSQNDSTKDSSKEPDAVRNAMNIKGISLSCRKGKNVNEVKDTLVVISDDESDEDEYVDSDAEISSENDYDDSNECDELAQEDALLTIHPKNNSLNLVYRTYGQTKFVKYISKNSLAPDEYVYILFATYKE